MPSFSGKNSGLCKGNWGRSAVLKQKLTDDNGWYQQWWRIGNTISSAHDLWSEELKILQSLPHTSSLTKAMLHFESLPSGEILPYSTIFTGADHISQDDSSWEHKILQPHCRGGTVPIFLTSNVIIWWLIASACSIWACFCWYIPCRLY